MLVIDALVLRRRLLADLSSGQFISGMFSSYMSRYLWIFPGKLT
jgi:hypothetical protein